MLGLMIKEFWPYKVFSLSVSHKYEKSSTNIYLSNRVALRPDPNNPNDERSV